MKHANISVFIPHIGCPHMCSFCNQRTISGTQHAPKGEEVRAVCEKALTEVKSPENTEIAFFGGSFTAIPKPYMNELLQAAYEFVGEGRFKGIRISTRPDCIDADTLLQLKAYGVTAIELGAQSMADKVLEANERGHTAEDIIKASRLIREYGFELGLQMMIGLYQSTISDEYETVEKIINIHPDTVRIYPVVILKGTELSEFYESGKYKTFTFNETVDIAADAMIKFKKENIRVIKCGLHASEFVEKDMVGGFYHPAFRELCDNRIYLDMMKKALADKTSDRSEFIFAVNPSCISKAVGQKRSNINYFREKNIGIKIIGDEKISEYDVELRR